MAEIKLIVMEQNSFEKKLNQSYFEHNWKRRTIRTVRQRSKPKTYQKIVSHKCNVLDLDVAGTNQACGYGSFRV